MQILEAEREKIKSELQHEVKMGTFGEEELDIPVLEEISAITGGQFFLALDRDELDSIYTELDRLEPAEVETISYRPKRALFHYPLIAAMGASSALASNRLAPVMPLKET